MRILIDATSVLLRSAGIKTYTYYWVQHLWQQAGNEQIHTFPRLGRMSPLDHERSILSPFETYRRLGLLYMINTSAGAPMMRWMTRKADVFHVSNQIRKPPKKVKLTATIHDMTSLLMPELHTPGNVRADASFTQNVLKRADRLIDRIRRSQQRTHIDASIGDELDRPAEFDAGAKCAAYLELLGHHRVHGQRRFSSEPNDHDGAERSRDL